MRSIAERGAGPDDWTLVLQPERERWLRAALVFDCGPTMPVWRPLWREIRQLVEQTGVFRRVDQRLVDAEGRLRYDTANDDAGPVAPDTLLTADGATVVLVVSDCMGPQWRPGPAGDRWYRRLRRWGKAVPVAVVQPLPERMWRETALPTTAGLIGSPRGAAPNSALTISAYDGEVPEGMPLPVLEPSAAWLSNWAALVAGPGSVERPGCVALLPDGGPAPAPAMSRPTEMTAEELVRRFRKTASPAAVRLAGHFSLGIPHVQVMRYIQTAVEPHSTPGQIAEVVLSGMLQSPPDDKPGFYEWRPGVKALLQRALPRSVSARTTGLLEDAGRLIAENAGTLPGRIRALVPVVARNRDPSDQAGGAQFALMDWDVLERLRGPTAIARPVPQPAPVAVAIVEAHPLVRLRLEDMVEAADGMVIAASVEDIAHLPLHPDPDVVVIDPFSTTTGPDVGRVASLAARSHVLVMSAAVRAADVVACVAAGASGYLGKHAGAHTFTTAVVTAARGEFVLSPELADILLGAAGSGAAAATLSATETAMLRAAAEGLGPAAIARRLGVATDEVRQCIAGVWAAYRGSRPTGDAEAPGGAVNDR